MKRLRNGATLQERIERYTVTDANGCWLWVGFRDQGGYGRTKMGGRMHPVHRLTYAARFGPIPRGQQVDHLCRVRACCNPAHLEAVTPTENVHRSDAPAAINRRKTHCNRGHELAGDNLEIEYNGHRRCRECRRIQYRTRYYRRKAERAAIEENAA